MKKGKIIIGICLLVVAFILAIAQTAYAVEPINLDGFEDMPTTNNKEAETTTETTTETNKQTNNTVTNSASNTGSQAKNKIPQTGSNSMVVFISGVTALTVIAIVIFKKFVNIKLQ